MSRMRITISGVLLGGVVGFIAACSAGWAWTDAGTQNDRSASTFSNLELFANVLERVKAEYVVEIDQTEAIEAALNGMLVSLDPHSGYLDPETFAAFQERSSGAYGGLGIEVTLQNGFVKVISPMDGSPAARAGVQAGDLITGINGKVFKGQSINDSVRIMRGEPGTELTLSVLRENGERTEIPITREIIQIESVKSRVINNEIGYIRISTFDERTAERLSESLDDIQTSTGTNPTGLILDLRNNGGGLLTQAVEVSSAFLDSGNVVSTRARRPEHDMTYKAKPGTRFSQTPLIVLLNKGSASASEIVAGALQDRGRATILGERSFGKGSVQNLIPLGGEKGAIRLTTSRYFTPSGRSIQAQGITPDLYVSQSTKDNNGLSWTESTLPNALDRDIQSSQEATAEPKIDTPTDAYSGEDFQLDRAVELLSTPGAIRAAIIEQQSPPLE